MSHTETQRELLEFIPAFCPNCGQMFERKDVKELEPENANQLRWNTFCGQCGAIYDVEIEG